MKKIIFTLFVSLCPFILFSQMAYEYTGPITPFTSNHLLTRINYDSIYFEGNTAEREHQCGFNIRKSLDGLNDTITINNGYFPKLVIISYLPDGKVKSFKSDSFIFVESDEKYSYDSAGRILEIKDPIITKNFYYTQSGIDSIIWTMLDIPSNINYKYAKEEIIHNSNGYDVYLYIFNNEKQIYEKPITVPYLFKYKFDINKRLISNTSFMQYSDYYFSEMVYEYNNNGYKNKLSYHHLSEPTLFQFIYNNNGLLDDYKYTKWNGSFWIETSSYKYKYINHSTSVNEMVNKYNYQLMSIQGKIVIDTEKPIKINIYSIKGNLVKEIKAQNGVNEISLPSGIYIVTDGKFSQKILIE